MRTEWEKFSASWGIVFRGLLVIGVNGMRPFRKYNAWRSASLARITAYLTAASKNSGRNILGGRELNENNTSMQNTTSSHSLVVAGMRFWKGLTCRRSIWKRLRGSGEGTAASPPALENCRNGCEIIPNSSVRHVNGFAMKTMRFHRSTKSTFFSDLKTTALPSR